MVGHQAPGQQSSIWTDMLLYLPKEIIVILLCEKDLSPVITLIIEMIYIPLLEIHLFLIISDRVTFRA